MTDFIPNLVMKQDGCILVTLGMGDSFVWQIRDVHGHVLCRLPEDQAYQREAVARRWGRQALKQYIDGGEHRTKLRVRKHDF